MLNASRNRSAGTRQANKLRYPGASWHQSFRPREYPTCSESPRPTLILATGRLCAPSGVPQGHQLEIRYALERAPTEDEGFRASTATRSAVSPERRADHRARDLGPTRRSRGARGAARTVPAAAE